jgi:hypothetical protein
LSVRIPLRRGVLDTTLCDQVCQWLATLEENFGGYIMFPFIVTLSDEQTIVDTVVRGDEGYGV